MVVNGSTFSAGLADPNQVGAGLISAFRSVMGNPAPLAFDAADNFDSSNALSNAWFNSSRLTGQVQVGATVGPVSPITAPNQLILNEVDNFFNNGAGSEADLNLAAPTTSNGNDLGISFQSSVVGSLPTGFAMPGSFTGFVNADGVAISTDGLHWFLIKDLSTSAPNYALSRINLSTIAAAAGLSLSSGFQLRFEAFTNNTLPGQGLTFDNVRVTRLKPTATATTLTTLAGFGTGSTTLGSFSDGVNPVGTYTASINWGDSTSSAGGVSVVGNAINVTTTGHTYATGGLFTYTITLTDTSTGRSTTLTGAANVGTDVSSQVSVTSSGYYYQRSTHKFTGTVTITNTGSTALTGSQLALAFVGLPSGVSLDTTLPGYTVTPDGTTPYLLIPLGSPLPVGQSITVTVAFVDPSLVTVTYTPKTFSFL